MERYPFNFDMTTQKTNKQLIGCWVISILNNILILKGPYLQSTIRCNGLHSASPFKCMIKKEQR